MDIYEGIITFLRHEYNDKHQTFKDMERKFGVSYQYLRELINDNDNKKTKRMSLEYFFRLFPRAQIKLDTNGGTVSAPDNHGNVAGVNNGVQTVIGGGGSSALLDRIMACPDIPAEVKVQIYALASDLKGVRRHGVED